MRKLTAIIPTFNEEVNIQAAIESVQFADEILIVDSYSTDQTLEIAKKYEKVKIIQREYGYSASQKNWAIPQASHEWILLLDADERVTPELEKEVKSILSQEKIEEASFWIKRQNIFMDQVLKYTWKSDAVIRLFLRDKCQYEDKHVHAEVITEGKVGTLQNSLNHDTYKGKGLTKHLLKGERYTNWGAYDRVDKTSTINFYHLAIKPLFAFVKHYFFKLGVLDGRVGFILSTLTAYNVFIRSVKIWRIKQGESFREK